MKDWPDEINCLGQPFSVFFDAKDTSLASYLCNSCKVLKECREETLNEDRYMSNHLIFGFKGGLSQRERRDINRLDRQAEKAKENTVEKD